MRAAVLVSAVVLLTAGSASAAWRMEIESKTVNPGQTGVTVNFTYAWDAKLVAAVLPVVVRSIDAGSFWTGTLPYDTMDMDGNRFTNGVAWHASIPPWSALVLEMRPGRGCGNSGPYDGVSPDHFVLSSAAIAALAAKPSGIVFCTIQFDVTSVAGTFVLDTACFSASLNKIFFIDENSIDHGPPSGGNGDVVFTKGVITISGSPTCDCSHQGDCNDNGVINPSDIIFMINYALRAGPPPPSDPACPAINRADWDCNGKINIADITKIVSYVYRYPSPGPCNPCPQ